MMLTSGVRARARIVQVGDAVAEAGPEMDQRQRRLARHACIAVGRAGADALEKTEHAAHARHARLAQ